MNIPQSNLDELMKDPKAATLLKDQALLQRVLQSPDTKRLMETLSQKFGDQLQHTAQSAVHGDRQALSSLAKQVMESQEGARLLQQLNQQTGEKK